MTEPQTPPAEDDDPSVGGIPIEHDVHGNAGIITADGGIVTVTG